jgi:hypothetical protein
MLKLLAGNFFKTRHVSPGGVRSYGIAGFLAPGCFVKTEDKEIGFGQKNLNHLIT